MDVRSGEIVAMVSLPDFDPNHPGKLTPAEAKERIFNKITLGAYEQPTIAQPEVRNFYPPTGVNSHNVFWTTLWLDK